MNKIEHEGVICSLSEKSALVKIKQVEACAECHAKTMCSVSSIQEKTIEISYISGEYQIGERVLITGATSIGLKAVLYAFVIPLIIIIATLSFTTILHLSESLAVILAIAALIIYYLILYLLREKMKNKFVFTLTKKI
ncbi:Fis family transcriptional regulator [Dysgonomonas sp. 216]|uniref:SoxR reducing system RseC family protein n=1 Tax=Dysgonomonas sp. 216 TaxID=2302934 RepID=UPI0013D1C491|nr:SoxR reducing system RseC family protein [Dysgonomonas sp. 216]NDW17513.1 Fis family transcriptional regulator [Dysgonomonas sp. 216]